MLLMPLCVILRRMMHISVLIFEGLFRLHKCARNDPDRHSGHMNSFQRCCQKSWSLKQTSKRTVRLHVRLSEHVSEQSCPLDVLHA